MYESESGTLEFDDTKDIERVHMRAGSYMEYSPSGSMVERVQKDKFCNSWGQNYSQRNVTVTIEGNANILRHIYI